MNDISKGHIYIIICIKNPKIFYIGSTFNQLKQRWIIHKNNYQDKHTISIYKYFDEYGIENFTMKLLKSYNVVRTHNKDIKHLRAYEQLWINKLKGCCNLQNAFSIFSGKKYNKNYYKENKEKIKENVKKYKSNNTKIYKSKEKDYVKEYNKNYSKIYYQKNKEKIKERSRINGKIYYQKNKS